MHIEHLYYFLDVANTLSISQSAKDLYISPQGLSQAIKSLEKEYDTKLFDRTKNGFVLTSEGEKFSVCAKEFIEYYETFKKKCRSLCPIEEGSMSDDLSIYTTTLFSASGIIYDILNIFLENSPNSNFLILEQLPCEAIESLIQNQSNSIALVNIPDYALQELTIPEELSYESIFEISMAAHVCTNSVHARKKFFTKQELVALPLSCYSEPLLEDCIRIMLKKYGEPNIVVRSSDSRLSEEISLTQDIVYLSVDWARNLPLSHRVTIPICDTLKLTTILLYRNNQKETPIIKTVISLIKSYFLENFRDLAIKI